MSSTNHPPSYTPDTPKTRLEALKEESKAAIKNTPGALMLVVAMLAGSALDNTGSGIKNSFQLPTATAMPLITTEKLPKIAEDNQQIYEFLKRDIVEGDTLSSLHQKLKTRLDYLFKGTLYDEVLYDIHTEMLDRQKANKPDSSLLLEASKQMRNEQNATKDLKAFFDRLSPEATESMNDALIGYYNSIGGFPWGEKEFTRLNEGLEKERKK